MRSFFGVLKQKFESELVVKILVDQTCEHLHIIICSMYLFAQHFQVLIMVDSHFMHNAAAGTILILFGLVEQNEGYLY